MTYTTTFSEEQKGLRSVRQEIAEAADHLTFPIQLFDEVYIKELPGSDQIKQALNLLDQALSIPEYDIPSGDEPTQAELDLEVMLRDFSKMLGVALTRVDVRGYYRERAKTLLDAIPLPGAMRPRKELVDDGQVPF